MQAGLLNFPIDIYEAITVRNDYGEETTDWQKKYSTKAKIDYTNGVRNNENQEIVYDYSITLVVRQYVPVEDFNRIYIHRKGKEYKYRILSIEPNDRQQNLTIRGELINE